MSLIRSSIFASFNPSRRLVHTLHAFGRTGKVKK